jgi:integrase
VEASRWLSLAEADLVRGTFVHPSLSAKVTVADWLEEWSASHSLHKRATTLVRDESAIRRHLVPRLGDIQLAKLRQTDVQGFVADLRREVGPGTTRSIYGVLRAALNAAVNAELLARSPARGIKLPQTPRTDVVTLRPQELHRLAAALPDRWGPMVYVAGACGLRFSEVAGLRVGRVDLAHRRLQVIGTAPQVGGDRAEPKTAAGRRTIPLPGLIAEVLNEHVSRYGLAGEARALVFSAPRGGRLNAANWHKRAWVPARGAAGLPTLRFHDLRHSAVPLWIAMGANLLQVSRWLGHSTVQITADVYGHLFPETNDLVIGRLDKHSEPHSPSPPTPPPAATTRTPTHGSHGSVPARNRHGAPSTARTTRDDEAATLTCAEPGSVHTFGGGVTCAEDGVRPRAARPPAPRQPPGWRARARP